METLLKLVWNHRADPGNPLLCCLTRPRRHQAKEVSEVFGAWAAVRTALDAVPGLGWNRALRGGAHLFCPGDGCRPYAAAAIVLNSPKRWRVWSIDPAMGAGYTDPERLGRFAGRCVCHRGTAEEFELPPAEPGTLNIVVSVHGHCDLEAFVRRIPRPVVVVSLPCCGECGQCGGGGAWRPPPLIAPAGLLEAAPLLEYEDRDILSPHRRIIVHHFAA